MEEITIGFQPKGSMCAVCAHKNRDCSELKFYEMLPILERLPDNVLVVKCNEFNLLN